MIDGKNELNKKRIFELDFLRGTLIFLMCLQHLCWFFYRYLYCGIWNIGEDALGWKAFGDFTNNVLYIYPYTLFLMSIAWCLFFLMSGISSSFSKSNCKRALKIGSFFIIIYIVAVVCQNLLNYPVILNFGIFLGYAVYILFYDLIKKLSIKWHIILAIILLAFSIVCEVYNFNFELNPHILYI